MKMLLVVLLFGICGHRAQAIVADRFSCEMTLSEPGVPDETKQKMDFSVARVPVFQNPAPQDATTTGSFNFVFESKTKKRTINADLNFYYQHALRSGANGQQPEARQATCSALALGFCDYTGGKEGDMQICSSGRAACNTPDDPFNPNSGWADVSLAPDGTPMFDEKILIPIESKVYDDNHNERGTVRLNCVYLGTYT